MNTSAKDIVIPQNLLPKDGRFGCGPSKIRPEALASLAASTDYLGTSHRQANVQFMVSRLRNGIAEMFALPDGYEVMLGNGGTTSLWDALTFGLIQNRSQHLHFGEFSSKFGKAAQAAPHLEDPEIISSEPGTHPLPQANDSIDLYALTQNETSTGVSMPLLRPTNDDGTPVSGLVAVDATSAAAGLRFDPNQVDACYFAPQKCIASDGGLWLMTVSPAAIERIESIAASGRWVPASLDLKIALDNSRKDQTYNTPALATIFLAVQQIEWINENGGLAWAASRCGQSAKTIYDWAEKSSFAQPFVNDPNMRSHVVATIDFDETIDAIALSGILRANGIVDTDSYRKLGRNQLRISLFPAIDPSDISALTACIDHVVAQLA